MNDEHPSGQPSNDPVQKGTNPQDQDESSGKEHGTTARDMDNEDDASDAESIDDMVEDIYYNTLRPVRNLRTLQERIKKGPKRAVQQMDYTRLMEDRMIDMEKRLRMIEKKGVESEPPTPPPEETNPPTDLIMDIKRMTFQEYLPIDPSPGLKVTGAFVPLEHKRRDEFPGQLPYHLIDVVVSAVNQPERLSKDQVTKRAAGSLDHAAPGPAILDQDSTVNDLHLAQPERVRINSTLLLDALEKITGMTFSKARVDDELELQDQVILRPFKLFVTFEQEIRDEIDRLEKIHKHNSNESKPEAPETTLSEGQKSPPPSTDVSHNMPELLSREHSDGLKNNNSQNTATDASTDGRYEKLPPLESRRCLEELHVLKELLDKDLKPTFDLRRQIKDGLTRSIAFQDLWHLFPLGTEIVSNGSDGQNQTYRIVNVSGGRPFLCSRSQADMDPLGPFLNGREVPKFEMLSYLYDFDGKELGACQKLHSIKSYDGNKAITSLPCFPVIYWKASRGLKPRDLFIERGRRFIELTRKTDVVHKRYDGRTLAMDELREEVRQTLSTV